MVSEGIGCLKQLGEPEILLQKEGAGHQTIRPMKRDRRDPSPDLSLCSPSPPLPAYTLQSTRALGLKLIPPDNPLVFGFPKLVCGEFVSITSTP